MVWKILGLRILMKRCWYDGSVDGLRALFTDAQQHFLNLYPSML